MALRPQHGCCKVKFPLTPSSASARRPQLRGRIRRSHRQRLPQALLIANEDSGHFTDQEWCGEIARAIAAANKTAKKPEQKIPAGASSYSFRHTRISDLLQVYGIEPLTTAQQTGTSIAMIEKFYFKFISSSVRDKLNAVKSA
jgi:hypothetical protein